VKEQGLWACHLGPELGGQGYGQLKLALMNEILGRSTWAPTVFGTAAPDTGNAEILALYGTGEQKARYLQPLLEGNIVSTFSMTEPQAGSDPKEFVCKATRDGDEWVIEGEKWFSSNARYASFLIVMAVTDPDARPHERMSMFIVPAETPGIEIIRNVATMNERDDLDEGTRATSATTRSGCRSTRCSGRRARASRSPSPGWAAAACTTPCGWWASASAFDMMCERRAVMSEWSATVPTPITFFVGSLFFTAAGFLQYRESVDSGVPGVPRGWGRVFVVRASADRLVGERHPAHRHIVLQREHRQRRACRPQHLGGNCITSGGLMRWVRCASWSRAAWPGSRCATAGDRGRHGISHGGSPC
jgi:hypothetical protein